MPKHLTSPRAIASLFLLGICAAGVAALGNCASESPNQAVTEPETAAGVETSNGPAHPITPSPGELAPPPLEARRELGLGAKPLGLCSGDFDGDGLGDLAVVLEKPGELRVFFSGPGGLSAQRKTRLAIGDYPIAPVAFGSPPRLAVASTGTKQLLVIDVGRADEPRALVLAGKHTLEQTPRALAPSPGGGLFLADRFGGLHTLAIEGADVREIDAIDIGARPVGLLALQDGGVVALTQSDESLHLFHPGAGGRLQATGTLSFDGIPRSAGEADLDGDGDLEQVFLGGDRRVLVFGLGEPAPSSWTKAPGTGKPLQQIGLVPMALAVTDLDKDGRADLVSLGQNDQGYSVMGSFVKAGPRVSISEYAGQDPWDLAVADFDGDGREDLAVACRGANSLSLLSGTGLLKQGKPAFAQARRIAVGTNPLDIAALDTNGDGKPEVATIDAADGYLSLLANDGFGGLKLATRIPVGPSPRALQPAHFQGPEHATELLLVVDPSGGSGRLVVLGKQSSGNFGILKVEGPGGDRIPAEATAGIVLHDVDGDGVDDLVMLDLVHRRLATYRVQPRAQGDAVVLAPLGKVITFEADELPTALAVLVRADAPSVLFAVGSPSGVALFDATSGAKVGTVQRPGKTGPRYLGPSRLQPADLDGDGSDDLVALWLGSQGTSPGTLSAHVLDESLGTRALTVVPTGQAPAGFAAADLNLDGTDDLVLAAQNSHAANLWLTTYKEGELTLHRQSDLGVGLGPLGVTFADLVGKGSLDILVSNAFSSDISVVLNRLK